MSRIEYKNLFGITVTESYLENNFIVIPMLSFKEEISNLQICVLLSCYRAFGLKRHFDIDFSRRSMILVEVWDIPKNKVKEKIQFFITLLEKGMET